MKWGHNVAPAGQFKLTTRCLVIYSLTLPLTSLRISEKIHTLSRSISSETLNHNNFSTDILVSISSLNQLQGKWDTAVVSCLEQGGGHQSRVEDTRAGWGTPEQGGGHQSTETWEEGRTFLPDEQPLDATHLPSSRTVSSTAYCCCNLHLLVQQGSGIHSPVEMVGACL